MPHTASEFKLLAQQPSEEVIRDVLQSVAESGGTQKLELDLVMTVIKYVVPVVPSLSRSTVQCLYACFKVSFSFVAHCMQFMMALPPKTKELLLFKQFMVDFMENDNSMLYHYVSKLFPNRGNLEKNSLKSTFFGSKLFNIIVTDLQDNLLDVSKYTNILSKQLQFLIDHSAGEKDIYSIVAEFTVSFLHFHPTQSAVVLFDDIFFCDQKRFNFLVKTLEHSSYLQRGKLFNNIILQILQIRINSTNYEDIRSVLYQLSPTYIDVNSIIQLKSLELQEIIIRIVPSATIRNLLDMLMVQFKNVTLTDTKEQDGISELDDRTCQLLFICFKYRLNDKERESFSHEPDFLDGITNRLGHRDKFIRERTMFLAKYITAGELKYESDYKIEIPDIQFGTDASVIHDINFENLHEIPEVVNDRINVVSLKNKFNTITLADSDMVDSDDEEYDSDNFDYQLSQKRSKIVFLKDLMEEYNHTNSKQNDNLVSLLRQTIKLVRQKKLLPMEVSYYATALLQNISSLSNNFDEKDFEQWRINALVSILAVVPEKVSDIYQIIFNKELSLQQRMSILTSIGLAARELRGIDDEQVLKPKYDFPSKRLPWDKTVGLSDSHSKVAIEEMNSTQNKEINDKNLIREDKTLWRSKKLEAIKDNKAPVNQFRTHAPQFFYPLAHGWFNGIDLGAHDEIFKLHYINTLRLVYSCSNPVHNYEDMTEMMHQIAADAMKQGIPLG